MDVVDVWTGRLASALQKSLRMSNEAFAAHLGAGVRTVASWHGSPEKEPSPDMQAALDTVLEGASSTVKSRFQLLAKPAPGEASVQALRVAIAVVVRGDDVLLVCRRDSDSLSWQFPAGVVKPGASPEAVAARETHGETGVHCTVRRELGSRLHPVTGVTASYFLCDYLVGEAQNLDAVENADVTWVPRTALGKFIPSDRIFPPILKALEDA